MADKNLIFFGRRIFFIGAHPDDIELGCGALISNINNTAEVFCITLSNNQNNSALNNLIDEHYQSMAILGVKKENLIIGKFETRRFMHSRQEILEYLIELKNSFNPDIVFVHSNVDLHQDHSVVTQETMRAFRGSSIFGFDVIRSSHGFFPSFLVEVTESDVEKKLSALAAYKTYADKYYFRPELTRAILIRNGSIAERRFAEGFDIQRVIGEFGKLDSILSK